MRLFCLLCIPLVYFLRQTIFSKNEGGIRALLLGGVMVVFQYFFSPLLAPGGFGLSRWMSGFIDIVSLPALAPFAACFLLVMLKVFSSKIDCLNFSLLWLMPMAAFISVKTSSPPSLIPLVLVPVLWIAQTLGIAFFISLIKKHPRWYVIAPLVLAIIALPLAATTSWWAFFSLQKLMGFLFLVLTITPAALFMALEKWQKHADTSGLNSPEPAPDSCNYQI